MASGTGRPSVLTETLNVAENQYCGKEGVTVTKREPPPQARSAHFLLRHPTATTTASPSPVTTLTTSHLRPTTLTSGSLITVITPVTGISLAGRDAAAGVGAGLASPTREFTWPTGGARALSSQGKN